MRVARSDAVGLTRELVRIDSRNPSLVAGGPGEANVAQALASVLDTWGFRVELMDAAPGRPNVIARIGTPGARSLMFNGHLDVVGIDGMIHDPWSADANGQADRLYGRGSSDMKAGIAAMCSAAARAGERELNGEIIIAAVVDEEYESIGTRSLIERGVRADGAIVTEPTRLAIMPAHLGFVWADVTTHGRAAHGSRWDIGVDAIRHAGILLAELDRMDDEELPMRRHALLGRPSVHASLISGGTGMSTYPDSCTVRIERRTIPGESPEAVRRELESACSRARSRQPKFRADVDVTFSQEPSDVAVDAPIVRALGQALDACGDGVRIEGMTARTDAALLNAAGIPAICFGPGDISLAHAAEEWVPVSEIERATNVLAQLVTEWFGGPGDRRGDSWRS
jgi:acetylornithine deacetylase